MKIEYLVLWIDDDFEGLDTDREEIEEFLEKHGIAVKFINVTLDPSNPEKLHGEIDPILNNPALDMIFIDYNMDTQNQGKLNGDKLITQFRNAKIFLPVVFYSSADKEMRKDAANSGVEGVYFSSRDRLADKVVSVMESLLQKEHTVKNTRGLLMESLSEVDATLGDASKSVWPKLEGAMKEKVLSYFQKIVDEDLASAEERKRNRPLDIFALERVINIDFPTAKYTTYSRWRLLKLMLELAGYDSDKVSIYTEIKDKPRTGDPPSLLQLRNHYAHKTEAELAKNHTTESCIYMRREISRHIDNLREIIKKYA